MRVCEKERECGVVVVDDAREKRREKMREGKRTGGLLHPPPL
jgi:hypothetical protein